MTTTTPTFLERIPLEVLNNGNFGLIDELVSTDFVDRTPQPGVSPTRRLQAVRDRDEDGVP